MVHGFTAKPGVKIESDATEITDGISLALIRPENAISFVRVRAWNLAAANYVANLDTFDNLKVSLRYGSDPWTKVFDGVIEDVNPVATEVNRFVECLAYGQGRALRNTHCNADYGKESKNSALNTPKTIWDDLVDNRINKNFAGGITGYAITKTYIANLTSPSTNFLQNAYRPNIQIINEVCQIYTAYRAGSASIHWFVDPSKNLFINTIGAHENAAQWPNFYGGSEANSLLEQGTNILNYSFSKRAHSKDFANKIILTTDLRKPSYDYLTEDSGGAALWGVAGHVSTAITNDITQVVVGSHSCRLYCDAAQAGRIFYPSSEDAAWDLTALGSEESVPALKFYIRRSTTVNTTSQIRFFTTNNDLDYFYVDFDALLGGSAVVWTHRTIPFGPYYKTLSEERYYRWLTSGSPDWAKINGFCIWISVGATSYGEIFLDDLHLTGKLVREAYNSISITAKHEHQKIVRMNSAVDDNLKASDDSGTAARLAYAELLTAQKIPTVGSLVTYGMIGVLPGQFVHVHAEKHDGTFRIDENFRIKEIQHDYDEHGHFLTTLRVTNDLTNTFAKGPVDLVSLYHNVLFTDPEAQSLKATGIDPLVPRLSKDYPS